MLSVEPAGTGCTVLSPGHQNPRRARSNILQYDLDMARRVFFSFHYERDIWRANVVRNSWLLKDDRSEAGFWDASLWEEAKRTGPEAIRRMINRGLENTSVTAVLIGSETADREWVQYEIKRSYERGNGLFGIYIHNIKDRFGRPDIQGDNPFSRFAVNPNGTSTLLSEMVPVYDWVNHDGYHSLATWVEQTVR